MRVLTPAEQFDRIHADYVHGRLNDAQSSAEQQRRKLAATDPISSYRFRLLEAEVFAAQGRSVKVLDVLQEGGANFVPEGDLAIKKATLLSLAFARRGQPERSAEELGRARALSDATNSALAGEVSQARGLIENRSGDKQLAETLFQASLDFARKRGDVFLQASSLLNLGLNALHAERIDEALDRFNASSDLAGSIGAGGILQIDLGNAGWAYYSLGDFEKALDSFRQAESEAQRLGAMDSQILWLQSSGLSLYRLGDLAQAESCYKAALQAAEAGQDLAPQAATNTSLGQLYLQLDQLDAAGVRADEAVNAARRIGDKASELEARLLQGLVATRRYNADAAEQILTDVYRKGEALPSLRWETENALADLYAGRGQASLADRWHRQSIATFETQRASVADEERRLPFFANGDALYRDYADFLIAGNRADEALRLLDGARARTLTEGLGGNAARRAAAPRPLDFRRVAARLDGVVLFYSLGPRKSWLWAIDRKGTRLYPLPAAAEIDARVKAYQAAILKSRDPVRERNPDAMWLYDALVAPAQAGLASNGRVFVIPTGSLNNMNMETLLRRGPDGPRYWIEDVSLSTASSIQLLARLATETDSARSTAPAGAEPAGRRLLLIGDPLPSTGDYPPLANAAAEVQSVQQTFGADARTTLTQAAAVPSAYADSHPAEFAYIHFVAHGTASSLRPLDSAIVLSPPTADRDHFKLYARDIVRRPLHARLVTISACYGSGLSNYASEGLIGLSWAFLRAGAHQVIGAMWEASDSSTPQLMDRMYTGLAAGETPDRALRAAKLSLLHSPGVYRKPMYWAAFQLYAGS